MTSLPIHLHVPHPNLHRVSELAHTASEKLHTALEPHEHHECQRYEFIEDALLSREMDRL